MWLPPQSCTQQATKTNEWKMNEPRPDGGTSYSSLTHRSTNSRSTHITSQRCDRNRHRCRWPSLVGFSTYAYTYGFSLIIIQLGKGIKQTVGVLPESCRVNTNEPIKPPVFTLLTKKGICWVWVVQKINVLAMYPILNISNFQLTLGPIFDVRVPNFNHPYLRWSNSGFVDVKSGTKT